MEGEKERGREAKESYKNHRQAARAANTVPQVHQRKQGKSLATDRRRKKKEHNRLPPHLTSRAITRILGHVNISSQRMRFKRRPLCFIGASDFYEISRQRGTRPARCDRACSLEVGRIQLSPTCKPLVANSKFRLGGFCGAQRLADVFRECANIQTHAGKPNLE